MTVAWAANGNPPGTRYFVLLSTASPYFGSEGDNVSLTTAPSGSPGATLTTLKENTSYYLYVRPMNHAGVDAQDRAYGSTTTLINAPQAVVFDEVSTTTILAVAYSPTPAYPNLDDGFSATTYLAAADPAAPERWTVGRYDHRFEPGVGRGRTHCVGRQWWHGTGVTGVWRL